MTHHRTPQPMELRQPLDYEDAREAYRESASQRRQARADLEGRIKELAERERDYRKGRSTLRLKCKEATVDDRKTELDALAADLRYERDVAKGMVEVSHQRLAEIDADRASLHRQVEWSQKLDPFAQEQREPVRQAA